MVSGSSGWTRCLLSIERDHHISQTVVAETNPFFTLLTAASMRYHHSAILRRMITLMMVMVMVMLTALNSPRAQDCLKTALTSVVLPCCFFRHSAIGRLLGKGRGVWLYVDDGSRSWKGFLLGSEAVLSTAVVSGSVVLRAWTRLLSPTAMACR